MLTDRLKKFFVGFEALPLQTRAPVLEEAPCLALALIAPRTSQGVLEQVGRVQPFVHRSSRFPGPCGRSGPNSCDATAPNKNDGTRPRVTEVFTHSGLRTKLESAYVSHRRRCRFAKFATQTWYQIQAPCAMPENQYPRGFQPCLPPQITCTTSRRP